MAGTINEQINLLKRGVAELFTEAELAEKLAQAEKNNRQLRIKLGLDPTSPDIHLGHTVVLRKMRQFQDLGHKAVLIIGDYTARIGDPTGQNTTRPILTGEQIEQNAKTYFEQAGKILDTSKEKLEVRRNGEWLAKLTLLEMIQIAAKKTVNQMLQRDTFKKRMQANIDVYTHEFLYPLMQGYDSVMVESDVELGGTDQTFNNLVGRDIQKAYGQPQQIVLTMPILVGLDGKEKMSKTAGNHIEIALTEKETIDKIKTAFTDPARKLRTDKGHPEACNIYKLMNYFDAARCCGLADKCQAAEIGCVECKMALAEAINNSLRPIRQRRAELAKDPGYIEDVLADGAERARVIACETLEMVKKNMKLI
jgi:tyrosyl-tRNA synthetase